MNKLLVISNHNPASWSKEQLADFDGWNIVFVQFPTVDPNLDKDGVRKIVKELVSILYSEKPNKICIQGEQSVIMGLAIEMADPDFGLRIPEDCWVIPTTERVSIESVQPDGTTKKEMVFRFCKWRTVLG